MKLNNMGEGEMLVCPIRSTVRTHPGPVHDNRLGTAGYLKCRGSWLSMMLIAALAMLVSGCGGGGGALQSGAIPETPVTTSTAPSSGDISASSSAPEPRYFQPPQYTRAYVLADDYPEPETAAATMVSTSTPSGFPTSAPTMNINMNTMGVWGVPEYRPGGTLTNPGIDLVLKQRFVSAHALYHFIDRGPTGSNACGHYRALNEVADSPAGANCKFLTRFNTGNKRKAFKHRVRYPGIQDDPRADSNPRIKIYESWFTYPHDAGTNDMKIHVRIKKAEPESKATLASWYFNEENDWARYWMARRSQWDPFLVEAYLEAPGSAVHPTGTGSATWTGKAIAAYSNNDAVLLRGDLIAGDASVTVNFNSNPNQVSVSLTNLKAAELVNIGCNPQCPKSYPNQTWSNMQFSGGTFESSGGGRSISGAFRTKTNAADTVGGVFEVNGVMKGGFVASR